MMKITKVSKNITQQKLYQQIGKKIEKIELQTINIEIGEQILLGQLYQYRIL